MAQTSTANTLSLEDGFAAGEGDRRTVRVRRELGIESFHLAATRALDGEELMAEHDEAGPATDGHEKAWIVLSGHAVFTVDGEEIEAPAGTVVHVPEIGVKRSAVAREPGTTILGIGARPGQPYRVTPGEAMTDFFPLHQDGKYEEAAKVSLQVLEDYPGNGLALFNLACCEALLGRNEEALTHLGSALEAAPTLRENAWTDTDLDGLRSDPRFDKLVA
jgi:tetratricopeptide (TPR) repeat protein